MRHKSLIFVTAAVLLLAAPTAQGAVAQDVPPASFTTKHAPNSNLPAGTDLLTDFPDDWTDPVPVVVKDAVTQLQLGDLDASINTYEWNEKTSSLDVYVFGDDAAVRQELASVLSDQAFTVFPAVNSKTEIQEAIRTLVGESGTLANGDLVAYAEPAKDGSSINLVVEPGSGQDSRVKTDGLKSTIPLTIETGERPETATRGSNSGPIVSGAVMNGQGYLCTTGFPVVNGATYGNLTADHCGGTTGQPWYYGVAQSTLVGNTTGQAAGGTDFEVFSGTSASNVTAYSYIAGYQNSSSVAPIKGYYGAPIGSSVCYNGSRSGIVCNNTVTNTGVTVCYAALQCYYNTSLTHQTNGTPALGQGDSGGPVIEVRTGGFVWGTGIISGISNGNTNCTGDAGGRLCSADGIFAPLYVFANNNSSWSFLIVP